MESGRNGHKTFFCDKVLKMYGTFMKEDVLDE